MIASIYILFQKSIIKSNFVILLSFIVLFPSYGQENKLFTSSNGLSNANIQSILQDKEGFMWIATEGGLYRFDGFQFKFYYFSAQLRTLFESNDGTLWVGTFTGIRQYNRVLDIFNGVSIIDNNNEVYPEVKTICQDKRGTIWAASSLGLFKYKKGSQSTFCKQIYKGQKDLSINGIGVSVLNNDGILWMGNNDSGLLLFDTNIEKQIDNNWSNSLRDKNVAAIFKDDNGDIIWGTNSGNVYVFRYADQKLIECSHQDNSRSFRPIYTINKDKSNQILLGTQGNGIQILNKQKYQIEDAYDLINQDESPDLRINTIYKDRHQNLWIGIQSVGLYFKRGERQPFHVFQKTSKDKLTLNYNAIKSILIDRENNLFIGTDGGGLNYLPKNGKQFCYFYKDNKHKSSIPDNAIITMMEDKQNRVWIGTYLSGLVLFNKKDQSFQSFQDKVNRNNDNTNYVTCIVEDPQGNFWIGTNGESLDYFNTLKNTHQKVTSIITSKGSMPVPSYITCLLLDSKHRLWIGSYTGLTCWYMNNQSTKSYSTDNKKLNSNEVFSILEDSNGEIAIGTTGGLTILNPQTDEVKHFTKDNGMPDNIIQGILEDGSKHLWISTKNGLVNLNINTWQIRNYFENSGLPSNEFNVGACYKSKEGQLYFGSSKGVVYFNPDSIRYKNEPIPLIINDLLIFNESVPIGVNTKNGREILKQSINNIDKIKLLHSENHVTIKFTAISYNDPGSIKYAYKLEGFDKTWTVTNFNQNLASYSYLKPGIYNFKVKIINNGDSSGNAYRTLIVQIMPPFWATWWAYVIYIIVIISAILLSNKLLVYRMEMQKKLEMEQLKLEHQNALHQSKIELFTNISHEIRTPLTLILGPVESLLKTKPSGFFENYLVLIRRNVIRILSQVNQLLESDKIERSQLSLNIAKVDIIEFIKDTLLSFESLKEAMSIELRLESDINNPEAWIDKEKVGTILYNLLSNAFKHSSQGGIITISLKEDKVEETHFLELELSDTGEGIPEEKMDKIFDRYYQIGSIIDKKNTGSGIGLHYTKSLILLHHGTISVKSSLGHGATFFIRIPINRSFYREEEIVFENKYYTLPDFPVETVDIAIEASQDDLVRHSVLIVEDDTEIRDFLKTELSQKYRIFESSNGKEGIALAEKHLPDLIISDIMMPEIDGLELCKTLKTNVQTSHIPIILLTAKILESNQIEGLETGADDYVTKPFSPNLLKVKIAKLIEIRENLKQRFSRTISFEANEMTVTSTDEKILQKAIDYVKRNISDTELNIEDMSKGIGLSRAQMYRKIKALTNQNPSEFVRTIRLKQAAYLLSTNKINISEVAYMVGFNSHQYFSTCFQQLFNMTPSEYAKKTL